MEENTFESIIKLEKEIQTMLGSEREKVSRWLADTKANITKDQEDKLNRLRTSEAEERETARRSAEDRAAALLEKADMQIERLEHLDDDYLAETLWQHLKAIVPGGLA
jgi:hypothetical protein